jgi:hypothetical protein
MTDGKNGFPIRIASHDLEFVLRTSREQAIKITELQKRGGELLDEKRVARIALKRAIREVLKRDRNATEDDVFNTITEYLVDAEKELKK